MDLPYFRSLWREVLPLCCARYTHTWYGSNYTEKISEKKRGMFRSGRSRVQKL